MKVRQKLDITAGHRNIKDGDPATVIRLELTIEAQKGEAVLGAIEKAHTGAKLAIVATLDRRPY